MKSRDDDQSSTSEARGTRRCPTPEGDFRNLRDVASDAELTNDEGEAPQSLAKVITQGPEGDIQNLRDVAGDAEVMNNEGEALQSPAKAITKGRGAS